MCCIMYTYTDIVPYNPAYKSYKYYILTKYIGTYNLRNVIELFLNHFNQGKDQLAEATNNTIYKCIVTLLNCEWRPRDSLAKYSVGPGWSAIVTS